MNRLILICMDKINGRFIEVSYPLLTKYSKKIVESKLNCYKLHVLDKIRKKKNSEICTYVLGNITFSIYPFIKGDIRVLTVSEWFKEKSNG